MKNLSVTFAIMLSCLTIPSLAADQPLAWKLNKGDQHKYRMIQRMDMEMSLGEADRTIETVVEQVIDMTWEIQSIDERGHAKVTQSVDRLRMNMQAPGQPELTYDTESEESPTGFAAMLAPLFKAMTQSKFTMTMSPRGELDDLEMPEEFAKALKNVPGAAMMGEMFSEEGFTNMIQKSSLILPEPKDLQLGHEWSTASEMKNPQLGTISSKMTYRYLGSREVEGTEYEVFGIKLEMDFGEGAAGTQIDIENQSTDGEILFNRAAGRLESSKLQQEIDMRVTVGAHAMSQKMLQKVFFERVEESSLNE